MKVRFRNSSPYYGEFTRPREVATYFALDIQQVQMWHLNHCNELHIFLHDRKKGFVLTKDSPELGSEANFNMLLQLLGAEFEDAQTVIKRLEGNSPISDHAVFSSQLWESTSTTPSID